MKRVGFILISSILFSGCNTSPPVKINEYVTKENIKSTPTSFDVGNGKKGATIPLKFGFLDKFKVKANLDGVRPKKTTDITHVKFYLTTSNTDPLNSSDLKFTSSVISYSTVTDTYTLENVPTGGPYYVAVELFDNVAGLTANNLIEPITYGTTTGTMGLSVSTNSVSVDSNNQVSSTSPLLISPILKSGVGATIEATITPQDGTYNNTIQAN